MPSVASAVCASATRTHTGVASTMSASFMNVITPHPTPSLASINHVKPRGTLRAQGQTTMENEPGLKMYLLIEN